MPPSIYHRYHRIFDKRVISGDRGGEYLNTQRKS